MFVNESPDIMAIRILADVFEVISSWLFPGVYSNLIIVACG